MIDYKELLRKYIDHVCWNEGTDFISHQQWGGQWTPEEWSALQELRKQP